MAIYKYITKKGYEGKYTILREYCKNKKGKEIKKATIRVETRHGIAAQVDWCKRRLYRTKKTRFTGPCKSRFSVPYKSAN